MRYRSSLLGVLALVACVTSALACGYHSGLENAAFDVVHPKSIGVAVAIRQATDRGFLESRPTPVTLASLWGGDYRDAVRQLQELDEKISRAAPEMNDGEDWKFAFVYVRTRLWAQYTVRSDGATVMVHTPAAASSEIVVLSDESVLKAINSGRLSFQTAVAEGLIQFSNDRNDKAYQILRAAFEGVGGQ